VQRNSTILLPAPCRCAWQSANPTPKKAWRTRFLGGWSKKKDMRAVRDRRGRAAEGGRGTKRCSDGDGAAPVWCARLSQLRTAHGFKLRCARISSCPGALTCRISLAVGTVACALLQKHRGVRLLIEPLWRCNRAAVTVTDTKLATATGGSRAAARDNRPRRRPRHVELPQAAESRARGWG
jgi:hypothetical protein